MPFQDLPEGQTNSCNSHKWVVSKSTRKGTRKICNVCGLDWRLLNAQVLAHTSVCRHFDPLEHSKDCLCPCHRLGKAEILFVNSPEIKSKLTEWEREFYKLTKTIDGQYRPLLKNFIRNLIRDEKSKSYAEGQSDMREYGENCKLEELRSELLKYKCGKHKKVLKLLE